MFIVGVDIAKRAHEAIIIDGNGTVIQKPFSFKNTSQGFEEFLLKLNKVSQNKDDFIIAMESTSHYWIAFYSALFRKEYPVKVMNPIQSDALRNLYIRQVKTDTHDCFIIAEVIRFGHYSEGAIQSTEYYELRELCRARTFIVDMCADLKKKVIAFLDQVFPEYETLFTDIFGLTSIELLTKCCTPDDIIEIPTEKLVELISGPSRKRFGIAKAREIKNLAQNSFGIVLGFDSMKLIIRQHVEYIKFMERQIKEIDDKLTDLFSTFECYITIILGIGPILGATIFSEIREISRFSSAAKLAAFAGIDPTIKQSGEYSSTKNHMSKRGSPYLRRAIWQASIRAAMYEPNLKCFLEKKRTEGKPYMNAIGHVTRKLTNIIYAVLRDKKPYYVR